MNSAGAVWVRKKRQCAGVDNNHTKMLSAVTAYLLSKKKFFFCLKHIYILYYF